MALCPLAIASTADQTNGTGTYYFALNGGGGAVKDEAFIAKGFGTPANGGYFQATSQDTTGAGTDAFIMTDISGVIRWGIGTSGVEAGANSGDNFAIYNYDDNGAFLSAPIQINRASGGVLMDNGLTVGNSLITTGALVADSAVITNDLSGATIHAPNGYFAALQPYALRDTMLVRGSQVLQAYTTPNTNGFSLDADAGLFNVKCILSSPYVPAPSAQTMALQTDAPEIAALPVGTTFTFALAQGSNPIELFVNAGASFNSLGTFSAPASGAPLAAPVIYRTLVKVAQSVGGAVNDWAKDYSAGAW